MFTLVKTALISTLLGGSWAAPIPTHLHARQGCSASGGHCATYYDVGLGACGNYNSDSEWVVAMNHVEWDGGSPCGRTVQITANTGKTANAIVVDLCPGCGVGSLDLSRPVFEAISNDGLNPGVIPISWQYVDGGNSGNSGAAGGVAAIKEESAPEPSPQPAWIPDSSTAEQPAWTPSTSKQPAWTPSTPSEQPAWTPSTAAEQPAWTPSSSSEQPSSSEAAWSEPAPFWTSTTSTAAAQSSTPTSTIQEWSQPPAESAPASTEWNTPAATYSEAWGWRGHGKGKDHGNHKDVHGNVEQGTWRGDDWHKQASATTSEWAAPTPASEWNAPAALYADAEPSSTTTQVEQPSGRPSAQPAEPVPAEQEHAAPGLKQHDVEPGADVDYDDEYGCDDEADADSDLPWCDAE